MSGCDCEVSLTKKLRHVNSTKMKKSIVFKIMKSKHIKEEFFWQENITINWISSRKKNFELSPVSMSRLQRETVWKSQVPKHQCT